MTFSTRAISLIELLIELAASAKRIPASSLGLLTGGFINVPLPHPAKKVVDITSSMSHFFMGIGV